MRCIHILMRDISKLYFEEKLINNAKKTTLLCENWRKNMDKKYEIYEVQAEMFKCNENFPDMLGFQLHWSANIGFGDLSFYYNTAKNIWEYDTECMGKEFCNAVLNKWIEELIGR